MTTEQQSEVSDIPELISTTNLEEAEYVRVLEPMFPGVQSGLEVGKLYEVRRDEVRNYLFPNGEAFVYDENEKPNYSFSTVHDHELYKTK